MEPIKINYLWYFISTCLIVTINSEEYEYKNDPRLAKIFEEHLIVPHLLPHNPAELCTVVYEPNFITVIGQPYYTYQLNGVPQLLWNHKQGKFHTIVMLGAYQKEIQYPKTTLPVQLQNLSSVLSPPTPWWHHWVTFNVFHKNLKSGVTVMPYMEENIPKLNGSRKLVYAFAIYEQPSKFDIDLYDPNNSPQALLHRYFTPLSKFVQSFKGSFLIAGSFFYVVHKPQGLVLDTSQVRHLREKYS